jgi:hypothetical protein
VDTLETDRDCALRHNADPLYPKGQLRPDAFSQWRSPQHQQKAPSTKTAVIFRARDSVGNLVNGGPAGGCAGSAGVQPLLTDERHEPNVG